MKPRFLLDENVSIAVKAQLKRLDNTIVVIAIGDKGAPEKGTLDPEILIWLEANDYILVTENRRTMPSYLTLHYENGHFVPGILWVRPRTPVGRLVEALFTLWLGSIQEQFLHRNEFIP
jgi:hypothetical protein